MTVSDHSIEDNQVTISEQHDDSQDEKLDMKSAVSSFLEAQDSSEPKEKSQEEENPEPESEDSEAKEEVEEKPTEEVEEKPTEEPKQALEQKPEETPTTEADQVEIPDNMSKKDRGHFKKVKEIAAKWENSFKETSAQLEQVKQELDQIKNTPPTQDLPEHVAKELEELRFFRALHDVENTPEFRSKFDDRVSSNEEHIYAILANNNFSKDDLEALKQGGGISNFILKGEQFGEDDGKRFVDSKVWNEKVLPNLTPSNRKIVENLLGNNELIQLEKKEALQKAPELQKEYFQNLEKTQIEQRQQHYSQLRNVVLSLEEQHPWAKYVEVKPTDSPEIKQKKEAQNRYRKEVIEPLFDETLENIREDVDPETRAQIAGFVVGYDFVTKVNAQLYKEVEALKKELNQAKSKKDDVRKASSMKPKASVGNTVPSKTVLGDSAQGLTEAQQTRAAMEAFKQNRNNSTL